MDKFSAEIPISRFICLSLASIGDITRVGLMTRLGVYSMRFLVIAPSVKFTVDNVTILRGKTGCLAVFI